MTCLDLATCAQLNDILAQLQAIDGNLQFLNTCAYGAILAWFIWGVMVKPLWNILKEAIF